MFHSISHEEQPLSHAIISNAKALVEVQQYLFETLWNEAIPAELKSATEEILIIFVTYLQVMKSSLSFLLK